MGFDLFLSDVQSMKYSAEVTMLRGHEKYQILTVSISVSKSTAATAEGDFITKDDKVFEVEL